LKQISPMVGSNKTRTHGANLSILDNEYCRDR